MKIQSFMSSLCMAAHTLIHILTTKRKLNIDLMILYITGITTNLLNYGTCNKYLIILDKSVMSIGACIDLYYIYKPEEYILLFFTLVFYFLSIITKNVYFRSWTHITITILHNTMIEV